MRQPTTGWIESRWTKVGDLLMHARVSANPVPKESPRVVLVHGIGITSRYWIPTLIRLGLDFHVAAPDLPGFGKSGKPERTQTLPELADWLAAWMRAGKLEGAALVGNSFGCQIIAETVVRHPRLASRVVFQGPTTDPHGNSA